MSCQSDSTAPLSLIIGIDETEKTGTHQRLPVFELSISNETQVQLVFV